MASYWCPKAWPEVQISPASFPLGATTFKQISVIPQYILGPMLCGHVYVDMWILLCWILEIVPFTLLCTNLSLGVHLRGHIVAGTVLCFFPGTVVSSLHVGMTHANIIMYVYIYVYKECMSLPLLYLFQACAHSSNSCYCTCIYIAKCQITVTALASLSVSIKPLFVSRDTPETSNVSLE